jgi:hypothetical protein
VAALAGLAGVTDFEGADGTAAFFAGALAGADLAAAVDDPALVAGAAFPAEVAFVGADLAGAALAVVLLTRVSWNLATGLLCETRAGGDLMPPRPNGRADCSHAADGVG